MNSPRSNLCDFGLELLYQPRDPIERAQPVEVDAFDRYLHAEAPLELQQQFHQLERVDDAAVEKVDLGRRRLDAETLDEDGAEALDDRVAHAAPAVCNWGASADRKPLFSRGRSILPLSFLGRAS